MTRRIKRRPQARKITIRVLSGIGRELDGWKQSLVKDDSSPAPHRDREAEFHKRIERELKELKDEETWPLAV